MIRNAELSSGESSAEFEVRYSEKFLREQKREDRKSLPIGAAGMLSIAIGIFHKSLLAFRAQTWVDVGIDAMNPVMVPPIVGSPSTCWHFSSGSSVFGLT